MRTHTALALFTMVLVLAGCQSRSGETDQAREKESPSTPAQSSGPLRPQDSDKGLLRTVSLEQGSAAQSVGQALDRKIIRNADLLVETDDPAGGQRRITEIADSYGGFVVTSESRQSSGGESVTVVARVPSSQFSAAIEAVRGVGKIKQEKVTGQDVTEEYIDLEARIRTKKALEAQFLEIMKQARKVSEALEVQREIGEVRTEIERLEGRRRFLDNQSSLSTLTVTLQRPAPLVAATTSGFTQSIKEAFGDGVDVATAIVLGLIRLIIVLTPVVVLILLPLVLIARYLWRRRRAVVVPGTVGEAQ